MLCKRKRANKYEFLIQLKLRGITKPKRMNVFAKSAALNIHKCKEKENF